jgi:hypothetical protein
MKFFVRAVITGFALSLGAALFKKVQKKLGLDHEEPKSKDAATEVTTQDGATDPGLRHEFS